MNSFRTLSLALLAGALTFAGCTTTHNSPDSTVSSSSSTTTTATTTSSTEDASAVNTAETKSTTDAATDQPTSLKDLPTKKGYPYAIKTKWPGLVKSPYAQDKQLVDVSTMASGTPARCPHTGKIFIVP